MGLDQTLYRTTKKCYEAKLACAKLAEEYTRRIEEASSSDRWKGFMDGLPRDDFGHYDFDKFSKEQRKEVGNYRRMLRKTARDVGIELDKYRRPWFNPKAYGLTDEELDKPVAEWRNNWRLHNLIVQNILENKENDNLTPIYLTKEDCEKIVSAGFIEGFKDLIRLWDDDHKAFYWAWY